jgi:hypothetical protein
LRASGLLAPDAALDLEKDQFALFTSPKGRSTRERRRSRSVDAGVPWFGQATDAGFANWYVDGYHRCVMATVELLQAADPDYRLIEPDFPRTPAEARRGRWAGLFTPHKVRWLGGTWFYGILDRRVYAMEYTNDSIATIHKHYTKIPPKIQRMLGCDDIRNPKRHLALVDVMIATRHQVLDWSAFWDGWNAASAQPLDEDGWRAVLTERAPKAMPRLAERRGGRRGVYASVRPSVTVAIHSASATTSD